MSLESHDFEKFSLAQSLRTLDTGPIVQVIETCERSFLDASTQLDGALGSLQRFEGLLPQLEQGLGVAASEELSKAIGVLTTGADSLTKKMASFSASSVQVKEASDHLSNQISDLDRVVRTIGTLAITARVIGHAMSPPEPKVAAFVENLSQMSVGAEEVLINLKEAMTDIRSGMKDQGEIVLELIDSLEQGFLLLMNRLAISGEKAHHRSGSLLTVNLQMAELMKETRSEVSRIIMALQVGDAVRQRFERAAATLTSLHQGKNIDHAGLTLTLTVELMNGAREHSRSEISKAVSSIKDLDERFGRAIRTVSSAYLDAGSSGLDQSELDNLSDEMQAHISRASAHLDALRAGSDTIINRLQHILDSERTLRQIAQRVRLAGANAIVICTQLGQKGRALREVAQWLRAMTDEAETVTAEMQTALASLRGQVQTAGIDCISSLSDEMSAMDTKGRAVQSQMHRLARLVRTVANEVREVSVCMPLQLNHTSRRLSEFGIKSDRLSSFADKLLLSRAVLPPSPPTIEAGSVAEQEFAELRRRYTMEAERSLHDKVIGGKVAAPAKTAGDDFSDAIKEELESVLAPAGAEDELDDIFF